MQYIHGSIMQTLDSVKAFVDRNGDSLGDIPSGGACRQIDRVAAALAAHATEQSARTLEAAVATQFRAKLRRSLIGGHMRPLSRIAAAELTNISELSPLRMPRTNVNDQTLAVSARAMASAAEALATVFVDGGLAPDFVARLGAAADALLAAAKNRADVVAVRESSTAGLAAESQAALKRIRVLDAFVRDQIGNDEALLAAWRAAKRIATKPGVARGSGAAADSPDTPSEVPGVTPITSAAVSSTTSRVTPAA